MRRCLLGAGAAVLWFGASGCTQFLAERMVAPPNGGHAGVPAVHPAEGPKNQAFQVRVGDPEAILAVWVLEPDLKARGTVLLLHGFLNDHSQLEGTARSLRDAGYRAVMVDLRGHGKSTGDHITFGVFDARDMADLTTYLQKHGLCGEGIGVFGASYGAVTALLFAANDPRVKAVVAVAPFASLEEEAPHFTRAALPIPGLFMSQADFTQMLSMAGQMAGFDPKLCSPVAAAKKTKAHILLFHGDRDYVIPFEASQEISRSAPEHVQLEIKHGVGHLALCFDPAGELHQPARRWFDEYLPAEKGEAAQAKAGR